MRIVMKADCDDAITQQKQFQVDHGHYIAYCRSTDSVSWFKFDDEEVHYRFIDLSIIDFFKNIIESRSGVPHSDLLAKPIPPVLLAQGSSAQDEEW